MAGKSRLFRSYALNYICSFGFVAYFMGFMPLHWQNIGFSPFDISLIMAVGNLSAMMAAPFFMRFLARHFSSAWIFNLAAAGAACAFLSFFWVQNLAAAVSTVFAFTFFWNATLIQTDAHAVHDSLGGTFRFERLRLWGSAGFILFSYLIGAGVDWLGTQSILQLGLVMTALMFLASVNLSRHLTTDLAPSKSTAPDSAAERFPWRLAVRFMLVVGFCWFSHAAMYIYLSLYLKSLGWNARSISLAWNIGVAAEMLMLLKFYLLERHVSLLTIMRLSLVVTILRWLILGSFESTWIIMTSQMLHAFTFASFHIASIRLIYKLLPENQRMSGQAMLTAWGGASGSFIGRLVIGWCAIGVAVPADYRLLFYYSAVAAITALAASSLLKDPTPDVRN